MYMYVDSARGPRREGELTINSLTYNVYLQYKVKNLIMAKAILC